jgi:hypothetical protein
LFAIPTLFFLFISIPTLTANTGFPIWLKNNTACPIGTILVSGLPQAEDHQVGRRVIFLVALLCQGGVSNEMEELKVDLYLSCYYRLIGVIRFGSSS